MPEQLRCVPAQDRRRYGYITHRLSMRQLEEAACSTRYFPTLLRATDRCVFGSPQEDQRVLAADIKRTRQAYAMFKRDEVMQLVSQVLERYCVGHGIRYKQGQNELIAPFVMLRVREILFLNRACHTGRLHCVYDVASPRPTWSGFSNRRVYAHLHSGGKRS